ncbi:MAG: hypothetical protein M1821_005337 [Bathelium mastoideum]|nr:MAG: hypothetical protein M1821_005337 [Bathelium mastoideum]
MVFTFMDTSKTFTEKMSNVRMEIGYSEPVCGPTVRRYSKGQQSLRQESKLARTFSVGPSNGAAANVCYLSFLSCNINSNDTSTSMCDGLPFWSIPESGTAEKQRATQQIAPAPSWLYRHSLHKIQTSAIITISRNLELIHTSDEPSFDAFINVFDSQVMNAVMDEHKDCNYLSQSCARLSIRAFHFFLESGQLKKPGILQVFTISCQLIDLYASLDASEDWASYCTHYFARMMLLAAYCILRIHKSELRISIDLRRGETSFFKAINLAKKRSTQSNDLDSRSALILTQLWNSHRAFRRKDGTLNGLHLHLRSRLFMSVIFDCFWWWRAEFNRQRFPYGEKDDQELAAADTTGPVSSPLLDSRFIGNEYQQFADLDLPDLDFQFSANDLDVFTDWNWAAAFKLPNDVDMNLTEPPDLK